MTSAQTSRAGVWAGNVKPQKTIPSVALQPVLPAHHWTGSGVTVEGLLWWIVDRDAFIIPIRVAHDDDDDA